MYGEVVSGAILSILLTLVTLVFLFVFCHWLIKYTTGYKIYVERTYDLVEIGYLEKLVSGDIDINKIEDLITMKYEDNKFRSKLREKMIALYIDSKDGLNEKSK